MTDPTRGTGEHSPLPWRLFKGEAPPYERDHAVLDANGQTVCDNEPYYPAPVSLADAKLIIHAVNSHEALLAALLEQRTPKQFPEGAEEYCWCGFNAFGGSHTDDCLRAKSAVLAAVASADRR